MKDEIDVRIGQIVFTKRWQRGISSSALAERIGVSRKTLWAQERGQYPFKALSLLKAMKELDISIDEIYAAIGGEG